MGDSRRLYADLGNRRLKLGSGKGASLADFAWREAEQLQQLRRRLEQEGCTELRIASSSAEGRQQVELALAGGCALRFLEPHQVPVRMVTLGTGVDRLLAAWCMWQDRGEAVVIADCGTAFTLDLIDREGCFQGGAIGAGLGLQQEALRRACPHLAEAHPEAVAPIPRDTAAAVAAGTLDAFVLALEGLAERFSAAVDPEPRRILTGGDAARLASRLPGWQVEEGLVLRALLALPEEVWA